MNTLCDIFIQDINDFFGLNSFRKKIGFSFIDKISVYFSAVFFFVFIEWPIARSVFSEKNMPFFFKCIFFKLQFFNF